MMTDATTTVANRSDGIAAIGELLIDFVALESGVTVGEASGFVKAAGGAPANVAVAVARLGVRASFLTQVGDDPFGHYLESVLRSVGVDTTGVRFSERARTMLAFVSLAADGERSFVFYRHPSADMLYRPEDIHIPAIDDSTILHFGSITLIDEPARSATLYAVDHARRQDKLISYDPNLRLSLWPSPGAARDGMRIGLPLTHILKLSDEELEFLTGGRDLSPLWNAYANLKVIAVTHGARGAELHTRSRSIFVPGFSINAVDTTGAGDGFVAGLLVQILERGGLEHLDPDLEAICRFANAVGAITCTAKGAIPALPAREQVEAFLSNM